MKKKTVAVRTAPSRQKAYIQWGTDWFRKESTMVLRFFSIYPWFIRYIINIK